MVDVKQGVLWDLDGVLFDTTELHFQTWLEILKRYDIPFTREMFNGIFGMKNDEFMAQVFGKTLEPVFVAKISDQKEELFRQMSPGRVQLLPGVKEWLARLKDWGISQAVASSAPQANVDTLLDQAEIRPFFSAVVSSAGLPGKPDPAVFLKAAALIDVPAELCVVIEDAVVGVEAAKRASMKCIAVTTSNPTQALAAADVVVNGLVHLSIPVFMQLLSRNGGKTGVEKGSQD